MCGTPLINPGGSPSTMGTPAHLFWLRPEHHAVIARLSFCRRANDGERWRTMGEEKQKGGKRRKKEALVEGAGGGYRWSKRCQSCLAHSQSVNVPSLYAPCTGEWRPVSVKISMATVAVVGDGVDGKGTMFLVVSAQGGPRRDSLCGLRYKMLFTTERWE